MRSRLAWFVAGVVLATAFSAAGDAPRKRGKFEKLDVFARVLTYVENNYVEEVNEERLVYGAVKGMLRSLDPHSAFMTPDEFAELKADTDGEFGGIGIEIDDDEGVLVVLKPIPNTPAARAGLQAGDRIIAIDGEATRGMPRDVSATKLRGRPGTKVSFRIERKGWKEPREMIITREIIQVPAVEFRMLEANIGYLHIKQFQERTDREAAEAMDKLTAEAGGQLAGLVLDLRGNPGGLLDQSVRVADLYLPGGVIVSTRGRGGRKLEEETARGPGTYEGFPIVCLVNGGSASAAEIVAGALQDHGRAVVLGTQSFGKGSVQSVIQLDDGSGLKLTVARYYTPSGRSIQEQGITPDIVVEQLDAEKWRSARVPDDGQRERDLDGHLPNQGGRGAATSKRLSNETKELLEGDYQLSMAVHTLRSYRKLQGSKSATSAG